MVREQLAFEPLGHGEHLYLRIRKRGLSTPQAVRRLCEALDASPHDAGWAGLKDRHAVTEQWVSLRGASAERARALRLPDLEVLQVTHHPSKLRAGRVAGNAFRIRVQGEAARPEHRPSLLRRWAALLEAGVPNYFGAQRFGRHGDNVARALAWARGGRPPRSRFERKMLPSALQAALFNDLLARRVADGTHAEGLAGDIVLVGRDERGPVLRRLEAEAPPPAGAIATGPLFGPRMPWPASPAVRALEARVLAEAGLEVETFRRFGRLARGARRPLLVRLQAASLRWEEDALLACFSLPSGAYATVVLAALLGAPPHDAGGASGAADAAGC